MGAVTALDVLREARRRGVELAVNGGRLRVDAPQGAMTPDLLDALRSHKAELLALVPEREPAPAPAVDYQRIYDTLTATFGTAEDLAACSWWYDLGHHDLPAELARREGAAERLARDGADEAAYRQAVEALVAFVRTVRAEYQRARQAVPAPAPGGPLLVAIADPCLTCRGTEYRLPVVNGLVTCIRCNEPPASKRRRGAG